MEIDLSWEWSEWSWNVGWKLDPDAAFETFQTPHLEGLAM